MFAGPGIERGVSDRVIKCIGKTHASIVYLANIRSELEDMFSMNPRKIVGPIADGRDTAQSMRLSVGLEHEAKTDVISVAVSTVGKRLTRIPIPEVVNQIVPNRPSMADSQAPRMAPRLGRNIAREILSQSLMIVDHIQPNEKVLAVVQGIVKFSRMRIQGYRRGRIKPESTCI